MDKKDIIDEVVEIPVNETEDKVGNVKIADDVVATVAGIATTEISGVSGMSGSFAGGIAEIFGTRKNSSRGVKVETREGTTVIDLYIVVDYGVRIPELAWEIQENVKNNVETITGLVVEKVNVHVEGVNFDKDKAENAANIEEDESPEEIIIEEAIIEELPEDIDEIQ